MKIKAHILGSLMNGKVHKVNIESCVAEKEAINPN